MSYDIKMTDPQTHKTIELPSRHQFVGGTYEVGGTRRAWLNVTYNYSEHYYRVFGEDGIRTIYGMSGEESIPVIEAGSARLGDDVTPNYWDGTEGNAKAALRHLVELAKLCPHGIWDGD